MNVDQIHPRLQAIDLKTGQLTPFFYKFLAGIWEKVGGFDDFILNIVLSDLEYSGYTDTNNLRKEFEDFKKELQPDKTSQIAQLQKEINDLKKLIALQPHYITPVNLADFQLISTSTAYTSTGRQIIVVTSNVTITLNSNPKNKEQVKIIRDTTAGTVTIDAGAKTVSGASTHDLLMNYESRDVVYSYPDDAWYLV